MKSNLVKVVHSLLSRRKLKKAMVGASSLKKAFRESPGLADIIKIAANSGVTEEQALMDVLFMLK